MTAVFLDLATLPHAISESHGVASRVSLVTLLGDVAHSRRDDSGRDWQPTRLEDAYGKQEA